jgi:hypothetical protein
VAFFITVRVAPESGAFSTHALHRAHNGAAQRGKAVIMADENKVDVTPDEPAQDDGKDYKAMYEQAISESRKWESRSKANAEKAKKYDEMADAKKTLEERVASIEAANKALSDEKERAKLVKSVAAVTGVPESIVSTLSATDEETMTAQAKAIAENYKTPGGAPKAPEAGKFPKEENSETDMRKFAHNLFSRK